MKKQIIYSKFIPRVFSMTIVLTPLMNIISHYVFLSLFNDFFVTYQVDTSNKDAFATAVVMPEFASYTPSKSDYFQFYSINEAEESLAFEGPDNYDERDLSHSDITTELIGITS